MKAPKALSSILNCAVACAIVSACGSGDTSTTTLPPEDAFPAAATELEGHWTSECLNFGVFGVNRTVDLEFNLNDFKRASTSYQSSGCQNAMVVIEEEGTFLIGRPIHGDVKPIDFSLTAVQVLPLSRDGQVALEAAAYCGYSSWPVGFARDVTALSGSEGCVPSVPRIEYDIFERQGATLVLGLKTGAQDGTKASRRPSQLNVFEPFTR